MNSLGWMTASLASAGAEVPSAFSRWLDSGEQEFGGWHLLAERGAAANQEKLAHLYPSRHILPFARRRDRDDIACLVRRDPEHSLGSVVVIHEDAMPGTEIEEAFGSLTEWFEQARNEVEQAAGEACLTPPS